jgi:hypothetical protein
MSSVLSFVCGVSDLNCLGMLSHAIGESYPIKPDKVSVNCTNYITDSSSSNITKTIKGLYERVSFPGRYIGHRQGQLGELAAQFTARGAVHPMQAMLNFATAIVTARLTRAMPFLKTSEVCPSAPRLAS